jgi:hypothetical protein
MRIVHFEKGGVPGIAADDGSGWHGLTEHESGFPGTLPVSLGTHLVNTISVSLNLGGNRLFHPDIHIGGPIHAASTVPRG